MQLVAFINACAELERGISAPSYIKGDACARHLPSFENSEPECNFVAIWAKSESQWLRW